MTLRGWRQARDQLHEWVNCADPQPIDGKYNGPPKLDIITPYIDLQMD